MNIGIIGSGNVGSSLGVRWAHGGHLVVFSSRHPSSPAMDALIRRAGHGASAKSVPEAVAQSDVILLATPWNAAETAIREAGNWTGKILIDAVNPLRPQLDGLELGTDTSAAERIAEWAAPAKVVKAFNTVGANIMEDPHFDVGKPVLFFCGDDSIAKQTVEALASELGFDARDAGPLRQARVLEPFALLWISLAYASGYGREIAFQLLRR